MSSANLLVVGGGLVGLATAYQALRAAPGLEVLVVEKEAKVAQHQSSHNSGVLHAGVYYAPQSLKARLCTAGKRELEAFAPEHGIRVERNGKLVVAVRESELPALERIAENARANLVEGVVELDDDAFREVEPSARGLRAVYSPGTGVVDFAAVAVALADEICARGGRVVFNAEVKFLAERSSAVRVVTTAGDFEAARVITCGGLQSDRLAALTDQAEGVRIVPFRGRWYELSTKAAELCRGHIYPVPDPRMPFLGVHVSRRIDGTVWAGPNAVLAAGREVYGRGVDARDLANTLSYAGFWRLARRYAAVGAREMLEDQMRRAYLRRVREYLPDVELADLCTRHVGVRAQAVSKDGALVDDFVIRSSARVTHVVNAPSPGATSCLAIGRHLISMADLDG